MLLKSSRGNRRICRTIRRRVRKSGFEALERRAMLSVTAPAPAEDALTLSPVAAMVGPSAAGDGSSDLEAAIATLVADQAAVTKSMPVAGAPALGGTSLLPLELDDGSGGEMTHDYEEDYNTPPTTIGLPDLEMAEDDVAFVDLYEAFDDAEDVDEQMTYELRVVSGGGGVVDWWEVDGHGRMLIHLTQDSWGECDVTIGAIDNACAMVVTTFHLTVNPVDDAPRVSYFAATEGVGSFWTVFGNVEDVDSPIQGLVVSFGGVLAPFLMSTAVQSDGSFSLTAEIPGVQTGDATAQVPGSEAAIYTIYPT